jgi:hypothetical protein
MHLPEGGVGVGNVLDDLRTEDQVKARVYELGLSDVVSNQGEVGIEIGQSLGMVQIDVLNIRGGYAVKKRGKHGEIDPRPRTDLQGFFLARRKITLDGSDDPIPPGAMEPSPGGISRFIEGLLEPEQFVP